MATVNHNFGGSNVLAAVPISGTVTVTIFDSSGNQVGQTTTDKNGAWADSFTLSTGSYTINYAGSFYPIGTTAKDANYLKPVSSASVIIVVPVPAPETQVSGLTKTGLLKTITIGGEHLVAYVDSGNKMEVDEVYATTEPNTASVTFQVYWRKADDPTSLTQQMPVFNSTVTAGGSGVSRQSGWTNRDNGGNSRWMVLKIVATSGSPTQLWFSLRYRLT